MPPQRQNSSLFKVLVNRDRRSKINYGNSENDGKAVQQPTVNTHASQNSPGSTAALVTNYEIMPAHYGAAGTNSEPERINHHKLELDPSNQQRYSNVPVAASNQTFSDDDSGGQQGYDYVVHAADREDFEESMPTEDTPQPRYEFSESCVKPGQNSSGTGTIFKDVASDGGSQKGTLAAPMDQKGIFGVPTVQHYAVSYATPSITRTMEVG